MKMLEKLTLKIIIIIWVLSTSCFWDAVSGIRARMSPTSRILRLLGAWTIQIWCHPLPLSSVAIRLHLNQLRNQASAGIRIFSVGIQNVLKTTSRSRRHINSFAVKNYPDMFSVCTLYVRLRITNVKKILYCIIK